MQAHSYSSLDTYNTCPHKYQQTRILKNFAREQGPEGSWGHEVHEAAEARVQSGPNFTMPTGMEAYGPPIDKICGQFRLDQLQTEVELAIDEYYLPAAWDNCKFRGKVDLLGLLERSALVLDWKTGKIRSDISQLEFYAMLVFLNHYEIDKIMAMYYWLKHRKVTSVIIHRQHLPRYVAKFTSWVANVENEKDWEPRPSGLCKRHCEVLSCPYNGRR